jgi:pimeloyl-ACP methyl ester carboxylesterase
LASTDPAAPAIAKVKSRDGTPIAFWRSGQGPPLVLVHGTSSDHSRWDPLLPVFGAHFTVYAVDRRGRGGSGDAPTYAVEREFEDVAAVVDSIGGPVSLFGHSYGALCALEAGHLTQNVANLILYEPPTVPDSSRFPPGFVAELEGLVAQDSRDEAVARFFQVVLGLPPQEIERMRGEANWTTRVAVAHTLSRETAIEDAYRFDPARFADVRFPTLLLQGGESPPFLKTSMQAVHAALPNSRLVVMEGQGHNAMRTAPMLLTSEVIGFLEQAT